MQWLYNRVRSRNDLSCPWHYKDRKKFLRQKRKVKSQIMINKIVDYFDPLSVRNLSKVKEFQLLFPRRGFRPLKDWFNDNPSN